MTKVFMRVPIAPYNAISPTLPNGKPNPGYERFGLNGNITDFNSYLDIVDIYYTQFKETAQAFGVELGVVPISPLGRSPNIVPFALGYTGYRLDMITELSREYSWLFQAFGVSFLESEAANTRVFLGGHPAMSFAEANLTHICDTVDCIFDAATTQEASSPLIQDILVSSRTHLIEANAIHSDESVNNIPRAGDWRLWAYGENHTIRYGYFGVLNKASQVDFRYGIKTEDEKAALSKACDAGLTISVNGLKLWDVEEFFQFVATNS